MTSRALDSRRYWLWVTGEEYFEQLPPAPDEGWDGNWTCHSDTREGDLALLYRKSPESNIAYIFQVVSDAYSLSDDPEARDKNWRWACEYKCIAALEHPLSFGTIKACNELSNWRALRANFRGVGGAWEIPVDVWRVLLSLIANQNPVDANLLTVRIRAIEGRLQKESELEDWIIADTLSAFVRRGSTLNSTLTLLQAAQVVNMSVAHRNGRSTSSVHIGAISQMNYGLLN